MRSEGAQGADYVFDFILLEEADGGDSGGSGAKAGFRVVEGDAAEGENGDLGAAGFLQSGEASGLGSGGLVLAEDGSKDGEVSCVGLGAKYVCDGMAGGGDEEVVGGQWSVARKGHEFARVSGRDVVGAEVDSVGVGGQGYVGA
jgi:hypothetical protein